ncbi:MAG: class I SAM-dependent RNA methyltransferase [Candidatus Gracilibacteria bacterium]|nr:class I SAM-dependent RNA methyltransferase [Candidatus Gracilibacteria bacterium]
MKFVLSTIAGVESMAKKEIEKQGGVIEETIDRLVTFSGGIELIPRINLWSRVGNKMYILLAEKENVVTFDELFDLVSTISWKNYFKKEFPIVVKSNSTRSELFAERTLQSLTKKAIVKSLVGDNNIVNEDSSLEKMEILVLLIDNKARILLNTSGNALHMRGYREKAGEAPIKESLAAALVFLSGWKFREPFYDVFCGSGTIAIEALMIAKNIAPGIKRKFAFEKLGLVSNEITENERVQAKKKEFAGEYTIRASDIDPEMIELAKENARIAGLGGEINFEVRDFREYMDKPISGTLVSNPPYGERLKDENLKSMYNSIDKIFRLNPDLNGGIISSFMEFDNLIKKDTYKKRKLYNGGEMCYFWKKNI